METIIFPKNHLITKRIIFYVTLSVVLIVGYATYVAKQRSEEMLTRYQQDEIYKIKHNLKNFVDVAYSTIDLNYKNSMDKEYLEKHYGYRLKNIIDVTTTLLELKVKKINSGKLTLAEAKIEAIEEIKQIRYDKNKGYIWITDTTLPYPKMIMHPLKPSLNGQIMNAPKYNNAMGKEQNLFVAFVEVAQKQGEGFVDYLWPRITQKKVTIDVPKLSYVRLFPEWNWIIGTDFYLDDAILDSMERSKKELRKMRYNNGIGFFWINNIDENYPQFYMYPISTSIENVILAGGYLDKMGEVVKSFIRTCKEKGSGYVEYKWDKPTVKGDIKDVPKLSYVKLYEPLGWIIGTGVYMDDVDRFIVREEIFLKQQILKLISNILLVSFVFIFFIGIVQYLITTHGHHFVKQPSKSILLAESTTPQKEEIESQSETNPKIKKPITASQNRKRQPSQKVINNYLEIAKEISKVMLAQTKLLTLTAAIHASEEDEDLEMVEEIKQLTRQVDHIVTNIQKKINS
ncbi:methyl-accepting chemotaxis sensory transducer [Beggiatoa sp. PS]|nr:methyl-accepting chemotaxis sensory transducer [Beggiatoa sp. PS]